MTTGMSEGVNNMKTVIAIALVAFIIGGLVFINVRKRKK